MVKSIFPCLLLLGLVFSCRVEQPNISLEYSGDQLVLNGFIGRDRIEVFVGRTQDFNGELSFNGGDTLHTATVNLVDINDSTLYTIPHVEAGNYVLELSTLLPTSTDFRLVANALGFPEAHSELIAIPNLQIDISATLATIETIDNTFHPQDVYLDIKLTDNHAATDFYYFYPSNRYRLPFAKREPFSFNARPAVYIDTEESLDQQCGTLFFDAGFIQPDFCFPNESFTFPLYISVPAAEVDWDSIGFTIATTSEFLYESARSLDQPEILPEELLFRTQLYLSNVEGGYGVVAPRHERVVWVKR